MTRTHSTCIQEATSTPVHSVNTKGKTGWETCGIFKLSGQLKAEAEKYILFKHRTQPRGAKRKSFPGEKAKNVT